LALLIAIAGGAGYCVWTESALAAENAAPAKLYYCPMHPSYTSNKPGQCPICNMDLVPVVEKGAAPAGKGEPAGHTAIMLDLHQRQMIGVQIGTVEKRQVSKTIRAVGRVDYDERTLSVVSLKFGGWVEELMVKSVGEPVAKGQPLFSIYSPELLEAQRNYLLARDSARILGEKASADTKGMADEALRGARERLLLWDFSEAQLKQIEEKGEPQKRVTICARTEGVVTARNILLGAYVEAGKELYTIADLRTVWMNADIYEDELPLVSVGQKAQVLLSSMPGAPLAGKVAYIYPYLNDQSRTVRVRMEFPNPDGKLKPGMYSTVLLATDIGEQLVVDENAVLFAGEHNIVFVDKGEGVLEPREVTIGVAAEGMRVILAGLTEGEKVVTSGNFLVDSESRLKAAIAQSATKMAAPQEVGPQPQEPASGMPPMPGM